MSILFTLSLAWMFMAIGYSIGSVRGHRQGMDDRQPRIDKLYEELEEAYKGERT